MHDFVVAEGGRRVVEVATQNHWIGAFTDMRVNIFGLSLSQHVGHGNLARQLLGFIIEGGIVGARPNGLACFVVGTVQVHGGEVDVVNTNCVAVETDVHIHRFVAGGVGRLHKTASHDAVFAENRHAELVS